MGKIQGQLYLIHQELWVGLDWYADHVGAVNGLPVRGEGVKPSDGCGSWTLPFFSEETMALRRHQLESSHMRHQFWGHLGLVWHPPHGLVLEAEARAGTVDVITAAAVIQQAGEGILVLVTGPEFCIPPSPVDYGLRDPGLFYHTKLHEERNGPNFLLLFLSLGPECLIQKGKQ
jgi:hypothetical protein